MADHFVDSANGNDANTGHDTDNAWQTLEYALESGALVAGDVVWVRRNVQETPASDVATQYDGTIGSPIYIIGCPRNSHSISSSDWTNGSNSVNIDDNDMDREKHQSRYITAPDGETYLITKVSATNTILIDREYAGSTALNQAATIQADEDYSIFIAIDDSAWTIKVSAWAADADDMALLDFNDGALQMYLFDTNWNVFKNIEFKDSSDADGVIRCRRSYEVAFIGCLFAQNASNAPIITINNMSVHLERCTLEGSGSGTNQSAIVEAYVYNGAITLKDVAIYNMGNHGIEIADNLFMENVNMGIEAANGDDDIAVHVYGLARGRDVDLGGTNGYVLFSSYNSGIYWHMSFENYGKILGAHKSFFLGGDYEYVAVSGETPNKKVSDYVWKISPNLNNHAVDDFWAYPVLVHEIEATAAAHTFKYWIYNDTGDTLNASTAKDDIWLKAEYVSEYDDISEYVLPESFSTETNIADAADADDWDYLQVTVTPAVASKVRLTIYLAYYNASTNIIVDPAVVIS